jgi:hypothetical protein
MKIEIVQLLDRGVANKERLWLRAIAPTDLQYYIVFDTTYAGPNSVSNLQRHAYWFQPRVLRPGDSVVLYTKAGQPSELRNPDGTTTYFVFWGLERTIWNTQADCAVLFEVSTWQTSRFGE